MTPISPLGILSLAVAMGASSVMAESQAQCAAPGEPVQWVADYCMLKVETDDEIAVSGCKPFPSACASNLHFKRNMCELVVRNGTRPGTVDQCVIDPTFKGRFVEAGGVGA